MLRTPYRQVSRVMSGAEMAAAESHGYLCGALCVSKAYTFDRWLRELGSDEPDGHVMSGHAVAGADGNPVLAELYDDTVQSLRDGAVEFVPLLPDDDAPLIERTRALAQWCQGFLYGFASAQADFEHRFGGDIREVLSDFAEISRAEVPETADAEVAPDEGVDEENEVAYTELFEFVRVSVQLVHAELAPARRQ